MDLTFELFVAWRYLWEQRRGGRRLLWIAILFALLSIALRAAALAWGKPVLDDIGLGPRPFGRVANQVALGCAVLSGLLLLSFGLQRRFNVFTTVSIFGVFVGSAALVIVLSVMSGFEGDLRSKILGTQAHAVVRARGQLLHGASDVLRQVLSVPGVAGAQPLVEGEVMLIGSGSQQVALLKGIDPTLAEGVIDLERYLHGDCAAGKLDFLAHPERLAALPMVDAAGPTPPEKTTPARIVLPGIVVGCELAKNLRLYLGDDIRVASPRGGLGPTGPMPRMKAFRVAGIFYSGMYEYDAKIAYAAIEPAQKLFGLEHAVYGVELKMSDPDLADGVTSRVVAALGSGYDVRDWRELNRSLFQALKLEKVAMFIVLTFIVMVASFSILANLTMAVVQKGREISILKAMGASSAMLLRVFVIQGLYIGTIGTTLGLLVGVGTCWALMRFGLHLDPEVYYIATLPVDLDVAEIVTIALSGLSLSVVATLYPAWLASRLGAAEALRHA